MPILLNGIRRSNSAISLVRRNSFSETNRVSRLLFGNIYKYIYIGEPKDVKTRYKNKYSSLHSFDIKSLLGKDRLSNKVWKSLWKHCPFECFQKNDYKLLKIKLLQQVNEFRRWHGVRPLILNPILNNLAEYRASVMAQHKTVFPNMDKLYGELIGVAYAPAASLIASRWYEEKANYDFSKGEPRLGGKLFTQLIWKNSFEFGIGINVSGDYIFVVCKISPKGNRKGQYKENVFDIQSKLSRFLHFKWFSSKAEK